MALKKQSGLLSIKNRYPDHIILFGERRLRRRSPEKIDLNWGAPKKRQVL
jgi:hypothetical protein